MTVPNGHNVYGPATWQLVRDEVTPVTRIMRCRVAVRTSCES